MKRQVVLNMLQANADDLKRRGMTHLYLFGSVARDEAHSRSDIDLFFDFDDPKFSLIDLAGLQDHLTDLLQAPTDVMTRDSLHPRLRTDIEASAVQVF